MPMVGLSVEADGKARLGRFLKNSMNGEAPVVTQVDDWEKPKKAR